MAEKAKETMNLEELQAEIEDMPSGNVIMPTGDILALLRVARAAQELTRTMEVDETIRVSGAGLYGLAEALAALEAL
jgi:short-subunit dehydrogenase